MTESYGVRVANTLIRFFMTRSTVHFTSEFIVGAVVNIWSSCFPSTPDIWSPNNAAIVGPTSVLLMRPSRAPGRMPRPQARKIASMSGSL